MTAPAPAARHLMAGSVIGAVSLILGPALGAIGTYLRHEIWPGTYPDYRLVDLYHHQNVLATQLQTLGSPLLVISVFATALITARASRKITGAAVLTSVFGLTSLLGKAVQNATVVAMAGISDHTTLNALISRMTNEAPAVLWAFPLYIIGSVLTVVALWRTPGIPRWSSILFGVGALAPVSVLLGLPILEPIIGAVRIAGSVPLIKKLLTPTADERAGSPIPTEQE